MNKGTPLPGNITLCATKSSISGTMIGSHLEDHYMDAMYKLSPSMILINRIV